MEDNFETKEMCFGKESEIGHVLYSNFLVVTLVLQANQITLPIYLQHYEGR